MSWSQTLQTGELHDQITILIGSAICLLCGEAGVFVVSNEAFDPQSSSEYTLYRLSAGELPLLLTHIQQRDYRHPERSEGSGRLLLREPLPSSLVEQLRLDHHDVVGAQFIAPAELCSLLVLDQAGILGVLHILRPAGLRSCFEQADVGGAQFIAPEEPQTAVYSSGTPCGCHGAAQFIAPEEPQTALRLFVAQLAAGLRSALKSQSLVKEQSRLAAIFQHSMEGILTVDSALRIIDFNPAMQQLTGWRESEVLGRFYYEVLRPKDRQGNDVGLQGSPILQAFAGQSVINREMIISARDGQRFDVCVTASCIRSARGEPMNGILNIRDITREREQEEERSTFISVISHELQTPIAIIKGYASTLARTDAMLDTSALHSRLVAIEEEADRLNKLVGNLLYASRIQAGGLHMEIMPLDLSHLVEGVVRRLQARSQDFSVTLEIPPNLPTVMADRDRIEEVLQNVLDNALKYSPRQRNLVVACSATGDEVIVSVSDTGMGISLRDQEHIFSRFHRVGNNLAHSIPGAGLGLYICRAIVEAHGGHIWVESTLHQGSTFFFSLPRAEKAHLPMVVF